MVVFNLFINFGMHGLVMACALFLVGRQGCSFSVVARRSAAETGMLPAADNNRRWLAIFSIERMLLALVLFLVGAGGLVYGVLTWVNAGLGDLEYASLLMPLPMAGTALVVSLQLGFTEFFAGLLGGQEGRR